MHRTLPTVALVGLLAVAVMRLGATDTRAQGAQPTAERVIFDAELWMGKGPTQQVCANLPPGDLSITASITRTTVIPTTATLRVFAMTGAMGNDETLDMPLGPDPATGRLAVRGGPYCWLVEASSFALNTGEPYVGLRLIHTAR